MPSRKPRGSDLPYETERDWIPVLHNHPAGATAATRGCARADERQLDPPIGSAPLATRAAATCLSRRQGRADTAPSAEPSKSPFSRPAPSAIRRSTGPPARQTCFCSAACTSSGVRDDVRSPGFISREVLWLNPAAPCSSPPARETVVVVAHLLGHEGGAHIRELPWRACVRVGCPKTFGESEPRSKARTSATGRAGPTNRPKRERDDAGERVTAAVPPARSRLGREEPAC